MVKVDHLSIYKAQILNISAAAENWSENWEHTKEYLSCNKFPFHHNFLELFPLLDVSGKTHLFPELPNALYACLFHFCTRFIAKNFCARSNLKAQSQPHLYLLKFAFGKEKSYRRYSKQINHVVQLILIHVKFSV